METRELIEEFRKVLDEIDSQSKTLENLTKAEKARVISAVMTDYVNWHYSKEQK